MPSLWSAISSSSSAGTGKSKSSNDILNKAAGSEQKRELTRQRKLRHITDDELGLNSAPVSPWSNSVTPHPLPRPQTHITPPRKRGDDIVRKTSTCSTYQILNLNTRSAPGSGHSSPVLSPQRYRTMDLSLSDLSHQMPNVHPLPRPPRTSLKAQWQRGRAIGCGTYGKVYIATHCETGATCAVKEVEMIPDDPKSAECIKQLEQEIKFLKDLKHPNIVQYYGCEIIEDRFCIYLEYVHPGSVNKYIHEHCGAMTESIIRNFTRHILSGLAYLHNTKTIHRDIKGANLLVNASGVVKLADFGLAKLLTGHCIDLSLKGTPHWMAPEVLQAVLRKDANPEMVYGVDIWSVGCTVVEMLTGKPPWSDYSGVQAMFNVLNRSPPIPEALSAEGKDFLQCCFQRSPEDRPSAIKLLDHPFVTHHNLAGFVGQFSGIKLHDVESTSEWSWRNKDARIQQGRLQPFNNACESNRHSCLEHSDHSAPQFLPVISSPAAAELNNVDTLKAVGNNNIYCRSNLTLLMPKIAERRKNRSQQIN
ncbi:hypothetical protein ACS0TY_013823 [Phlomoides rotata]